MENLQNCVDFGDVQAVLKFYMDYMKLFKETSNIRQTSINTLLLTTDYAKLNLIYPPTDENMKQKSLKGCLNIALDRPSSVHYDTLIWMGYLADKYNVDCPYYYRKVCDETEQEIYFAHKRYKCFTYPDIHYKHPKHDMCITSGCFCFICGEKISCLSSGKQLIFSPHIKQKQPDVMHISCFGCL